MDRDGLARAIPQAWTLWQLFLPALMAVSKEDTPEHKFRRAEIMATGFSFGLCAGLSVVQGKVTPLVGWGIGVPVMFLLYEWSFNHPDLTF